MDDVDPPGSWSRVPSKGAIRAARSASQVGRTAVLLSGLAAALMLVSSVAGVFVDGIYRDPPAMSSMLRGFDLVTMLLVVPCLGVALAGVARNRSDARVVWVGLLAATVYTYAIFVFGTAFNALFLVHVGVLSCALFALVLALPTVDVALVAAALPRPGVTRAVSVFLAVAASGLGGRWIHDSLVFALTGEVSAGSALVESEAMVHLGMALDLAVLVPVYATGAVLLWRQARWGYVLAAVALVSGVVHQVAYLVALPVQKAAGVPGAVATDPAEPVIAGLFLVACASFLAPLRRRRSSDVAGRRTPDESARPVAAPGDGTPGR